MLKASIKRVKAFISTIYFVAIGMLILFPSLALASGDWNPTKSTINLPANLEVPENTPVDQVIWTSTAVTSGLRDGDSSTSAICGTLAGMGTTYGNNIYATGISGIGVRLRAVLTSSSWTGLTYYLTEPGTCTDKISWTGSQTKYYTQTVYLELVRIAGQIGSGSLNFSNISATLKFNCPAGVCLDLWTISIAGTLGVKTSSCAVNTYDKSVDLGTNFTQRLKAVGTTSNDTNFVINMSCTSTNLTPSITFTGSASDVQNKVFANDSGSAKGVGVQLLYGNNIITPDLKLSLGSAQTTLLTDYNFKARIYQTENIVTAGNINATIIFTMDYSEI